MGSVWHALETGRDGERSTRERSGPRAARAASSRNTGTGGAVGPPEGRPELPTEGRLSSIITSALGKTFDLNSTRSKITNELSRDFS